MAGMAGKRGLEAAVCVVVVSCLAGLQAGQHTLGQLDSVSQWSGRKEVKEGRLDENVLGEVTGLIQAMGWTHMVLLSDQEAMTMTPIPVEGMVLQQHVVPCSPESPHSVLPVDADLLDDLLQLERPNVVITGTECVQAQAVNWLAHSLPDQVGRMSPLVQDSQWLLVIDSHVMETLNMTSLIINHVAVLLHDQESGQISLKTLTWTQSRRHLAAIRKNPKSRVPLSPVYPNHHYGCNGMTLRVAINTWEPYIMAAEEGRGTVYTGFSMDLLDILAAALNFTYTLALPEDGEWGDYRDGQWTGVVGQIDRQEVDFSVAPLTPKLERRVAVDWTAGPLNIRYTGIGVHISDHNALLITALFRPFHWQVYVAVLAAFMLTAGVITVLVSMETRLRHGRQRQAHSVFLTVEFLFGSFFKEIVPSVLMNHDGVGRPLVAAWCTFGLLVTACYTSNLTSLLVGVSPAPPFNSLQEMVQSREYRWGMIGGTALLSSFRFSNNSVMKEAYQGVIRFAKEDPDVLSLDAEVHRAKMAAEAYAFIEEEDLLDLWAAEDCSLRVIRGRIVGMETYNVFTPKGSVLTKRIDAVLLRLEAGGVMHQLKALWWPLDRTCASSASSQSAITLPTMQGAFYLAATGLALALMALGVERGAGRVWVWMREARRVWLPAVLCWQREDE